MARRRNEIVPGTTVGGYRIVREIGRGGMATVFEAKNEGGERFAIRILQAEHDSLQHIERFEREGQILYALRHENLVSIRELGSLDDGRPFQVMELLEGVDLLQRFEEEGMLAIHDLCSIVIGACRGVHAAHGCGVVHRDLKPANIYLARNEAGSVTVKVLDFGVAKTFGEESLTPISAIVGSPQYLAPEQLAEKKVLLRETDVWALGVVLYRGLTENLPFEAPNLALLCRAILESEPKSIRDQRPDCPEELERVVLRCLEKKPSDRFSTLEELAKALAPFAARPQRASRVSDAERQTPITPPIAERDVPRGEAERDVDPVGGAMRPREFEGPPSWRTLAVAPPASEGITPPPPSARALAAPPPSSGRSLAAPPPSSGRSLAAPPSRPSVAEAPAAAPRRRSPLLVAALAVAVTVGGGSVGYLLARPRQDAESASASLRVNTKPEGAFVSIDYGSRMPTSQPITVKRDGAPHTLYVWKEGHRPETRSVVFSGDVSIDLVLEPLRD